MTEGAVEVPFRASTEPQPNDDLELVATRTERHLRARSTEPQTERARAMMGRSFESD